MMFAVWCGDYNGKKRYSSMHSCFEFRAEFLDGVDGQSPELRAPHFASVQKFDEQMVHEAQTHAMRARAARFTSEACPDCLIPDEAPCFLIFSKADQLLASSKAIVEVMPQLKYALGIGQSSVNPED